MENVSANRGVRCLDRQIVCLKLLQCNATRCDGRKRDRERPRATSDVPPIPKPHAKKVYIRFRFHYLKGGRLD